MARQAKPYVERGWYVSRPSGRYLRLCPVEDGMTEAKRLLKIELGKLEAEREKMGGRLSMKMTVIELFLSFLEQVKAEKDDDTFLYYQRWLTVFAQQYGSRPARGINKTIASDFKLWMMTTTFVRGKQPPKKYKAKTVNHALIALRRAFNWAIDTDRLPEGTNPFAKVELLPCQGRKRIATDEEYLALQANCLDDAFGDVLVAMRHTSARPQDIYGLKWSMVHWDGGMWVLEEHKGMRTANDPQPRVIGMNADVEKMLRRRLAKYGPDGHVFLNRMGKPWTKDSLGLRMRRLRKKAGIKPDERGEEFVLYTNRHTFLTKAGADPTISQSALADIAGHTDPSMTAKYVHPARLAVAEAGRRVADRIMTSSPA